LEYHSNCIDMCPAEVGVYQVRIAEYYLKDL
jgi:hypothetical protein